MMAWEIDVDFQLSNQSEQLQQNVIVKSATMSEGGTDCKQFLYALLGKKKLTPDYSLRNSGEPNWTHVDRLITNSRVL